MPRVERSSRGMAIFNPVHPTAFGRRGGSRSGWPGKSAAIAHQQEACFGRIADRIENPCLAAAPLLPTNYERSYMARRRGEADFAVYREKGRYGLAGSRSMAHPAECHSFLLIGRSPRRGREKLCRAWQVLCPAAAPPAGCAAVIP